MAARDYYDPRQTGAPPRRNQRPPRYEDESDSTEDEYSRRRRRPAGGHGRPPPAGGPGYPVEQPPFREKRDGYLSDEGESLKKSRKPHPSRRDDSDSESGKRSLKDKITAAGAGLLGGSLAHRPKERPRSAEPPYGDSRGGRDERQRPRRAEYNDDDRRPQRSKSHRESGRGRYDDDDDYDEPPRKPRDDPRRRSGRGGLQPPEPDRGYRSDQGNRRRDPPRRDDYDRYEERPRRDDRYRDYHSDHDDRRRGDPRRRDDYDRSAGGRNRDRYRSSRDYDDDRGGRSRSGKGGAAWQKDAGQLFLTYGLPYLKKEGPQLLKQAQSYWAKRGGGGGLR